MIGKTLYKNPQTFWELKGPGTLLFNVDFMFAIWIRSLWLPSVNTFWWPAVMTVPISIENVVEFGELSPLWYVRNKVSVWFLNYFEWSWKVKHILSFAYFSVSFWSSSPTLKTLLIFTILPFVYTINDNYFFSQFVIWLLHFLIVIIFDINIKQKTVVNSSIFYCFWILGHNSKSYLPSHFRSESTSDFNCCLIPMVLFFNLKSVIQVPFFGVYSVRYGSNCIFIQVVKPTPFTKKIIL